MARTVLAVQSVTRSGLNATYTAATVDGHAFDNTTEKVFLHVKNQNAGTIVVTIQTPITVDGLAVPDRTVSIPTASERFIGIFPKEFYSQNDVALSLPQAVYVNTDVQASVTYAAVKLSS